MYETIVCGVSQAESGKDAARVAHELAGALGATLHLVMAFEGSTDPAHASRPQESAARDAAESFLAELVDDNVDRVGVHAIPGDAGTAILRIAQEVNADLIVVGNKGMRGRGRVLGSVPNTISHKAACSVLIVNTTD